MPDPSETAFGVAADLRHLGTGEMAALRRLDEATAAPAFWRLAARHEALAAAPDRWAPIVRALALLTPKGPPENRPALHHAAKRLGAALCDGCDPAWPGETQARPLVSERRLAQLLAARGLQRTVLLTRAIRALAARRDPNHGLHTGDLAWAFLRAEDPGAIAGPYYRRLDAAQRDHAETETKADA